MLATMTRRLTPAQRQALMALASGGQAGATLDALALHRGDPREALRRRTGRDAELDLNQPAQPQSASVFHHRCRPRRADAPIRSAAAMPRDGAITFRDIIGKLEVLWITCDKCGRRGQYPVDRLIARYGIDAKINEFSSDVTADCPRKSPTTPL
jgi:hypothetical protein